MRYALNYLVQDFCPLKIKITQFPNEFRLKHHVYGKRERQKYHVIMNFPPYFMFAVFNVKRPVLAFVNNASIPLKFLIRFATITSLFSSP